jgi:hypothetical protein
MKKPNGVALSYMKSASIIMQLTNGFLNYLTFQHKYNYLLFHHLLKNAESTSDVQEHVGRTRTLKTDLFTGHKGTSLAPAIFFS